MVLAADGDVIEVHPSVYEAKASAQRQGLRFATRTMLRDGTDPLQHLVATGCQSC